VQLADERRDLAVRPERVRQPRQAEHRRVRRGHQRGDREHRDDVGQRVAEPGRLELLDDADERALEVGRAERRLPTGDRQGAERDERHAGVV
jgi:hypothetical protein